MICLKIFLAFVQIGLFSIGGGYAAMPLIQSLAVEKYGWLTMSEFTDMMTISEITPGPIAINCATFVGNRMAGIPGAIIATAACILPSLIIVSIIINLYFKYKKLTILQDILSVLRPVVVALIAVSAFKILTQVFFSGGSTDISDINFTGILIFIAAFFIIRKTKKNPITVMMCCGVIGLVAGLISEKMIF